VLRLAQPLPPPSMPSLHLNSSLRLCCECQRYQCLHYASVHGEFSTYWNILSITTQIWTNNMQKDHSASQIYTICLSTLATIEKTDPQCPAITCGAKGNPQARKHPGTWRWPTLPMLHLTLRLLLRHCQADAQPCPAGVLVTLPTQQAERPPLGPHRKLTSLHEHTSWFV
jgi:hypothetical protein